MKMKFCYNYCFLIAITSISFVTFGFRAFVEKRLRPSRISFNSRSIRNHQINVFSTTASTPSKLLKLYNSPDDGDEWISEKPYFVKEKGSLSAEEAAVANISSNSSFLDEDIVSTEEKISNESDKDTLNKNALPDTDDNRLDWNTTKQVLSKFVNVSSCFTLRFYFIFQKSKCFCVQKVSFLIVP
jgi:hypothetical protein